MEAKTKTIGDFKLHERDTGSADVQIALLTQRINHLTEHLQKNKKDRNVVLEIRKTLQKL
jgi:small subunit ribosomal protein S15